MRTILHHRLVIANSRTMTIANQLYYISNADLPGKKAHTIQQVRMCQAFQQNNIKTNLIHPSYGNFRKRVSWKDIKDYYGLEAEFEIRTVPSLQSRFRSVPQIGLLSMAGSMTSYLVSKVLTGNITGSDVIYGRNYYGMFIFNELRKIIPDNRCPTLVFEIHNPISAHLKPRFFKSVDYLVSITQKLKQYLIDKYSVDASKYLPNRRVVSSLPLRLMDRGCEV